MKKTTLLFAIVALTALFISAASASAATINTYTYTDTGNCSINNAGYYPSGNGIRQLYFPKSTIGSYSGGNFEYDPYYLANNIDSLTLTLNGSSIYETSSIDIFMRKNSSSAWTLITSYTPRVNANNFHLMMDVKNNKLYYSEGTGGQTLVSSNSLGISLADFYNIDSFQIGYGCSFNYTSTDVVVSVKPVPEPTTLLLLGAGLSGIALIMGRKRS